MKIAVALMSLLVVAMATATIIESKRGSAAAMDAVYGTFWFRLLLALFALNVLASLIEKFPWNRQRIGYVITHGSMLVILAGALMSFVLKVEGHLALWEGEEKSEFEVERGSGGGMGGMMGGAGAKTDAPEAIGSASLPFRVRLDSFEIDYYQGTMRPAMFRSRVTVKDPASGREFPAVIEMNKELSYGGYKLFQSSYRQVQGREMTVLSVSRDPGQAVVFLGYLLLIAGMITVIGIRMSQGRALPPAGEPAGQSAALKILGALALFAAFGLGAPAAGAATLPDAAAVDELRRLPVQHDGRVMPLDTLAREAAFNVTGRIRWKGTDPVALVLGWSFDPDGWVAERIFPVGRDIAEATGMAPGTSRASFAELVGNRRLMELANKADEAEQRDEPLSPLLGNVQKLTGKLTWMQGFLRQEVLKVIPAKPDPRASWSAPPAMRAIADLQALARQAPGLGCRGRRQARQGAPVQPGPALAPLAGGSCSRRRSSRSSRGPRGGAGSTRCPWPASSPASA